MASITLPRSFLHRGGILEQAGAAPPAAGDVELATVKVYHVADFKGRVILPTVKVYHVVRVTP